MTEELKRYGQASDGCMEIHDGGDWVSYSDYEALQQDAKTMAEALMCLVDMYNLKSKAGLEGKNYNITIGQMDDAIELAKKYTQE